MSRKNKLMKFAEMANFRNVYQVFEPAEPEITAAGGHVIDLKGKWGSLHFKNKNPITLELGCGKGDYSLALAKQFPNRNFIGVDIKGSRIWKGADYALANNIQNVAFLRTRIEVIEACFEKNEISEIWITFPDPFLRESKENRRLTAPAFLTRYRNICTENPLVHLKTDSPELYEYTMEILQNQDDVIIEYHNPDIYAKPLISEELRHKTYYEEMHLEKGLTIKYIKFKI